MVFSGGVLGPMGPYPQYGWDFPEKLRKNSGKTPETLSERFLEFPSRVRLVSPKPYNSRHLRLPEHFQNSLPPSTAGDASFSEVVSGEGLSEPVMEFPAVLGVSLTQLETPEHLWCWSCVFPAEPQSPNGKNTNLHKTWGVPPIPERAPKSAQNCTFPWRRQ